MTKKIDLKSSKLLANNWVITLTATLIGVFVALYLNEWVTSNNLSNKKEIAKKNISAEISSNQKNLEETIIKHTEYLDFMEFWMTYINDEDNLITPADSMNKFRNKHPNLIVVEDSILVSDGEYKYNGKTNIADISTLHLNLTTIAWKTLINSGLSSTFGFECLMYLESIDALVNKIIEKDQEFLEYATGLRDGGVKNEKLIAQIKLLIGYEKILLETYKRSEVELEKCD